MRGGALAVLPVTPRCLSECRLHLHLAGCTAARRVKEWWPPYFTRSATALTSPLVHPPMLARASFSGLARMSRAAVRCRLRVCPSPVQLASAFGQLCLAGLVPSSVYRTTRPKPAPPNTAPHTMRARARPSRQPRPPGTQTHVRGRNLHPCLSWKRGKGWWPMADPI